MPAAMRPTQDHHGSRRQRCAPGASRRIVRVSDMSSKSSSHRHTRLQRDRIRPPVGAPFDLDAERVGSLLGLEVLALPATAIIGVVYNPPALASPVCDLPRPLANRCYCEAGECEVESAPTLPPFAIPRCSSLQIPKNAPCSLSRENPLQHLETIKKFDRRWIDSPCNF
jgi:hypothetical protein